MTAPPTRTGRRPGRTETRDEILTAARGLFAERGYDKTSIRAIARAAQVDPALVHHYFGTKEELFQASLELPVNPIEILGRVAAGDYEGFPERLVGAAVDLWDDPVTGPAVASVLRRVLTEPGGTELVRTLFTRDILATPVGQQVAQHHPGDAGLRLSLVASQVLGLAVARRIVGVEPLASLEGSQVVALLLPGVRHALLDDDLLDETLPDAAGSAAGHPSTGDPR